MLDDRNPLRGHALVVDLVGAENGRAARPGCQRRIVDRVDDRRGDLLPQLARQRRLIVPLVAAGLGGLGGRRPGDLIAQQLLHELRRRQPLEQHGARARRGDGRVAHGHQLFRHRADGLFHLGQRRQAAGGQRRERHEAAQLHPVGRLRVRHDVDARRALVIVDERPLAGDEPAPDDRVRRRHARGLDVGKLRHQRRELPGRVTQRLGLGRARRERDLQVGGRLLREVADGPFFLAGPRLPLGGGALAGQRLQRRLVRFVGAQPQLAPERGVVVFERDRLDARAALEVGVVEARVADAQVGPQHARAVTMRRRHGAQRRVHRRLIQVRDGVGEVVRLRLVAEVQVRHRTRQLVLHGAFDGAVVLAHGGRRRVRRRRQRRADQQQRQRGDPTAAHHGAPFALSAGAGSTGGLSFPLSRRSVSICCTSRLGLVAETGTNPDSAPQYPLKVW